MNTAKIKISLGQISVEYEGDAAFLDKQIFSVLEKVSSLGKDMPAAKPPASLSNSVPTSTIGSAISNHSTNTIASELGVKSGSELTVAACAHLTFVKGKDTFTRTEILSEMKSAPTFYNDNMSSNLSKILDALLKNKRLNLVSKDTYALAATEKKILESKLAQPA